MLLAAANCGVAGAWRELARSAGAGQAALWWERAAKTADPEALYIRGILALRNQDRIPVPTSVGIDLLKAAATKRWPEACYVLGEPMCW